MKKNTRENILKVIMIVSIIGLLTSIYLVENHYAPPSEGSLCDLGESISCSLVNTSVYSELFHVPVALFGALWFVVLFFMSWKAIKKDGALISGLLLWSILGVLFVTYMIIAEIILKALCPFCTLVHLIVFSSLILSVLLYKAQKRKPTRKSLLKTAKPWIIVIVIMYLIPLVYFNLPSAEKESHDVLAKCITQNDVKMYSSFLCGVCAKTRAMFGDSFQYIEEIECHPRGENPQTDRCLRMDVKKTPTWILEKDGVEIKKIAGFQSLETLAEFSNCQLEDDLHG